MDKFISANGIEVFFKESGTGQPLILLHGATDTHRLWDPHIQELAGHFRVITPDSRGHGLTFNPYRELSYRIMADDLAGFIQELNLNKPFVFGYSDGGQAVLDFGMRYPELPGALVIGGAWYRFSEYYQAAISTAGFVSPGKVDWEIYQKQAPPDWEDRMRRAHPDPDPDYHRILLEGLARLWWTPLNYTEDDFRKITVPTLIIMGENDEMIALDEAEDMSNLIPGAQLLIIPDAKHNQVLEPGGKAISFLFNFFQKVD
jgi:pimeloyl-ACP methyl ester carboxylesterase